MSTGDSIGQTLVCPQCGGAMDVYTIATDRRARCEYCRSDVDLSDVEGVSSPAARAPVVSLPSQDDKLAKYSLIAGVIGLFGFFPLVASIFAIVLGRKALAQINAQPQSYSGEQSARNGILLGWIGLGLNTFFICAGVALNLFQALIMFIQQL